MKTQWHILHIAWKCSEGLVLPSIQGDKAFSTRGLGVFSWWRPLWMFSCSLLCPCWWGPEETLSFYVQICIFCWKVFFPWDTLFPDKHQTAEFSETIERNAYLEKIKQIYLSQTQDITFEFYGSMVPSHEKPSLAETYYIHLKADRIMSDEAREVKRKSCCCGCLEGPCLEGEGS